MHNGACQRLSSMTEGECLVVKKLLSFSRLFNLSPCELTSMLRLAVANYIDVRIIIRPCTICIFQRPLSFFTRFFALIFNSFKMRLEKEKNYLGMIVSRDLSAETKVAYLITKSR